MSGRPVAILKNRLYVPSNLVTEEDLEHFTYSLNTYGSEEPVSLRTYKVFANDYTGFARGDMGKINSVFGDRFDIEDQRALVPHGFPLKFIGKLRKDQVPVWDSWFKESYGMIKCPPRFGKCITGDSLVLTDRGLVPIRDLYADTSTTKPLHVVSHKGLASVSLVYNKGIAATKKLTTYCGSSITGTNEHPVLVLDDDLNLSWIPLSEVVPEKHHVALTVGSRLFPKEAPVLQFSSADVVAKTYNGRTYKLADYNIPATVTPELARLLGYLVSEGGLSNEKVQITNLEPCVLDDFRKSFFSCFGHFPTETVDRRTGVVTLGTSARVIVEFFKHIGLEMGLSADQHIPWCILQSPRDIVVQFLRAYFDGDGTINESSIEMASASSRLVSQVHTVLLNLGVVSRISTKVVSVGDPPHPRTYYRLIITGTQIDAFNGSVGFGIPRKSDYASCKHKSTWTDDVPYVGKHLRAFIQRGASGVYTKDDGTKFRFSFPPSFSSRSHREYFHKQWLKDSQLINNIGNVDPVLGGKLAAIADLDLFFDKVTSIEDAGEQEVFDLTVPGPHSFTANGIIVHNTVLMTYMLCKLRQRAIVLAHESGLLQQFEDTVRKFTNINELEKESGVQLCGQLRKYDDVYPIVTFSTWQILNQPGAIDALKANRDAFGVMFVDEAHACAAPCFSKIVSNFNPYYRVPVTATDRRKDGFEVVVSDVAGPVVAEGHTEQLKVKVSVVWTKTELRQFGNWNGLLNQLVKNNPRNELIAKTVVDDINDGHSCVVFTDRREHARTLMETIVDTDPSLRDKIDILVGGSPKTDIRDRARSGETLVVIASPKIVQLGWDVPRWSSLHNTLPMANEPNWYQRLSRVRTPCPGCPGTGSDKCLTKDVCIKPPPVVRIYADPGHNVTYSCLAVMNRVHTRLGFEVETIKPQKSAPKSTSKAKKWSEVG